MSTPNQNPEQKARDVTGRWDCQVIKLLVKSK